MEELGVVEFQQSEITLENSPLMKTTTLDIEEPEEDALDRELDAVAEAFSYCGKNNQQSSKTETQIENKDSSPPSLTFEFPGWEIDITYHHDMKNKKQKSINVVRHGCQLSSDPSLIVGNSGKRLSWLEESSRDSQVNELPKEVWFYYIFPRLELTDLCSLMQTSRFLYFLASEDEAWASLNLPHCDGKGDGDALVPRCISLKHAILSSRTKQKFSYLAKGYDHLRSALNAWWDAERPDYLYSSKTLYSLIRKMTTYDWTILYEGLAVIFLERVDKLAGVLLPRIQSITECSKDGSFFKRVKLLDSDQLLIKENGLTGKLLWQSVVSLWKRYKHWLIIVSGHCRDLNTEVMIERERSATYSTPTLYDKGVICFRNQILLRYQVRNALQCGLSWLFGKDAADHATEVELELLSEILHLLQEADVADDFTLPSNMYTRPKLNRCFLLNKVANRVVS